MLRREFLAGAAAFAAVTGSEESKALSVPQELTVLGGAGKPAPPATNIILNGDFSNGTANWSGFGFDGKSVSGGKAVFAATGAFDGFNQTVAPNVGKYYELQYTTVITSGTLGPFISGGVVGLFTTRTASGTYKERIQIVTGNDLLGFQGNTTISCTVDDITLTGPYNTSTVGGA